VWLVLIGLAAPGRALIHIIRRAGARWWARRWGRAGGGKDWHAYMLIAARSGGTAGGDSAVPGRRAVARMTTQSGYCLLRSLLFCLASASELDSSFSSFLGPYSAPLANPKRPLGT
jgi:hypothetical protein